jgi:hypothetical protein
LFPCSYRFRFHIAVTVNTANTKPNFYGNALRQIRGFHFWLRRRLGQNVI